MFKVSRRHDFREMYNINTTTPTVDGTKNYNFPTNYKVIISIRVIDGTNSKKLTMLLPNRFDQLFPYPEDDSEGRPDYYIPLGNTYDLYRIPDAAYDTEIRNIQWPTVITATSDLISYEPNKDDMIVSGMTVEAFKHLQLYEDAALWAVSFKAELDDAVLADEDMLDFQPRGAGFVTGVTYTGEYWNDPLIRSVSAYGGIR